MDSLIVSAARALSAGDMLGALKRVALRDDPPALALRGIAMAQLGEHVRARELLRLAARGFGAREPLAHARCVVAEAEVALAMRDLQGSTRSLVAAIATLTARNDRANAVQAQLIGVRRALLLGRLDLAATALDTVDTTTLPASFDAVAWLARAELAMRSLQPRSAEAALVRAQEAASRSHVPALLAEVAEARSALERPAARVTHAGETRLSNLGSVAALIESGALVVDACRHRVLGGEVSVALAGRPVLFSLARALAHAWPGDADRNTLIAETFRTRHPDETHRARLRVEMGRLRKLLREVAHVDATPAGFSLRPLDERPVAVMDPPLDGEAGALMALLADGAAWSTSALALAMDTSQRTVQRALADLEEAGSVRAIRQGRTQRWLAPPLTGFTTSLLLPTTLPPE